MEGRGRGRVVERVEGAGRRRRCWVRERTLPEQDGCWGYYIMGCIQSSCCSLPERWQSNATHDE